MDDLEKEYHEISLRNMIAKTPAERKEAEKDREKFIKEHPDVADEIMSRRWTEY
ncbi:MAG: hypothetical protein FWE58_04465 [Methanobrevibacter sp.]|nr:hypothetical protein [Methanobrevibacter sp.]